MNHADSATSSRLSALPTSKEGKITLRLEEIEDAWAEDQAGTEAIPELLQLHDAAVSGVNRHLAFCLIELLEERPHRNDGEVYRLLTKRTNCRWSKLVIRGAGIPDKN